MSSGQVVELGDDDLADARALGILAFGGDPTAPAPPLPVGPPTRDAWGVRDARGRLVAKAVLLDFEQWFGGRRVPMGGVAGVAVHPDARGQGWAGRVVHEVVGVMRERGQSISALYPTVVGLYRSLGWEIVGQLDETRLPTRSLGDAPPASGVTVRTAEADDAGALLDLYRRWASQVPGALVREGRPFPDPGADALEADVVSLAEDPDGRPLGYLAYDRGRGYRESAELEAHELVSLDAGATRALLHSLGRWHPVAPSTRWHGPTTELGRLLPGAVPPPERTQPWMLAVVDPPAAVAARGWAADVDVAVRVVDDRGGDTAWRLQVQDGDAVLERAGGPAPALHERGLALLYSGAADTAGVRRLGLLDGDLPGLDAALAGPAPVLLDYF